MTFSPGDIVECVERAGGGGILAAVEVGQVFTVTGLSEGWRGCCDDHGFACSADILDLRERGFSDEVGFCAACFRLLKRRDADLMHRLLHEPAPDIWTVVPDREPA